MPETDLAFIAPASVEDVLAELAVPGSMLIGGGTAMALMARGGLIEPSRYVALNQVPELRGVRRVGESLVIGTTTTLRELSLDPQIRSLLPSLASAASKVGNPRVRSVATLGGAICHGDPRQDVPPVLLSLGATLRVASSTAPREIAIEEFYTGFMESQLADGELVTSVLVPINVAQRTHYQRFTPNSADDYPTIAVALAVGLDEEGLVRFARVAVGGVATTAVLSRRAGELLDGGALDDDQIHRVAAATAQECDPTSDNRGSAEYKRAMIGVVLERGLIAIRS